ncbi:hypothetical protein PMI14_04945 [Acidovorax sp. CF316]|uniref:lysozyme inhibitor LprI family protein n=1 Tax=Acidovorax sp. CF316 TaxID=1144317 RepID=UPI00026BEC2B|nr:lysozyme inhibitor LprI family protein [Acidovorax sp. CF316]EJE50385.1 hypothetical protein PMI14_04945 [Acidovorax sp. CF316]
MRPCIAAALLMALAPLASAASFDCTKAKSPMEKLICSDAPLSALDEQLNTAFKEAITRSKARPQLVQWQREWLKSYEVTQCKDARCLAQEFSGRIALLQSVAPASRPSAQWNGSYTRYLQGKPDKDSASLAVVGLQGGKVYLAGDAVWLGPNAANGQVNVGEIRGVGTLRNGLLAYDSDGCTATLALQRGGLAVREDDGCGGMNVSFVGEYRRK